jgi:hypothetical protein
MCKPKNLGGLGIFNTYVMNKCLIIKWWWKILTSDLDSLWLQLLKAEYFPDCSPMFATATRGSQFWRDLIKVWDEFRVQVVVGNGESVRFWLDWWCGDAPLSAFFPVLFTYCSSGEISTLGAFS